MLDEHVISEIAIEAIEKRHALQKPWELSKFLEVLQQYDPKVIYEIGVSLGGTLWAMASALPGPRTFVSIDLPNGPFGGSGITTEQIGDLVLEANPEALCIVIRGDSKTVQLPRKYYPDVVFIDGDHTASGAYSDFYRYMPLVKKDGIIAFHDIVEHPIETGVMVKPIWDNIKNSDMRTHEIFEQEGGPWGGIGIVYL